MAISGATRKFVAERAGHRCEYCHADERWQFVRFTIDHLLPRSSGGSDQEDNLALACRNCNERRGNRRESEDPQTGEPARLFDPRLDSWNEHFAWDKSALRIAGLSPIGRTTVFILDMNDDKHSDRVLHIRRRDLADGFHPPPLDHVLDE